MTRLAIEPGIVSIPDDPAAPPRLLGSRCEGCGTVFHPPRRVCPQCYGQALQETALEGAGTVYAHTCVHARLRPGQRAANHYWVVQVDLDAGPRVQGIWATDSDEPEIGMRVGIALETLRVDNDGNEIVVHQFRRTGDKA